ncbi:MAG: beta-lactamase [Armatimonadetes bacterium]|jgi:beta-lactamase class A|nr:beta-lactamase [Armatimonadota bacterium]
MNQQRSTGNRPLTHRERSRRLGNWLLAIFVPALLLGVGRLAFLPSSGTWLGGSAQVTAAPADPAPIVAAAPVPDPAVLARQEMLAGLQSVLEQEAALIDGRVSLHVRLDDGGEAGIEPDRQIDGASVIKIPVMVALYQAWESGDLKRTAADERRLRLMITRSKNIVTNELIERLGMARVNSCMAGNGYVCNLRAMILKEAPDGPNLISAAEMTRMLQQIVHGELVSPSASAEMRKLLLAQHWRERIPGRLPKEAVVGNKTGTMHNLLHDVAFIEAPSGLRYYVAVLIERQDRSRVRSEEIARLSRRVYDYLTVLPAQP